MHQDVLEAEKLSLHLTGNVHLIKMSTTYGVVEITATKGTTPRITLISTSNHHHVIGLSEVDTARFSEICREFVAKLSEVATAKNEELASRFEKVVIKKSS